MGQCLYLAVLHSLPDEERSSCRDFLANTVAGTLDILVRGAKELPASDVSTYSGLLCACSIYKCWTWSEDEMCWHL